MFDERGMKRLNVQWKEKLDGGDFPEFSFIRALGIPHQAVKSTGCQSCTLSDQGNVQSRHLTLYIFFKIV